MNNYDDIRKILDSSAGASLKDFLIVKLNELKDINNISEKDTPTHQALETKAQKRAYSKLKEIMEVIITFSIEEKPNDPRDSFQIE